MKSVLKLLSNKLLYMKLKLLFIFLFFQIHLVFTQNDLKDLNKLIIREKQLDDSLKIQHLKVDSLVNDLLTSIEIGLENQRKIDSLKKETVNLQLLMSYYKTQLESLTFENNNLIRLARLRYIFTIYPQIALPFSYHVQGGSTKGIYLDEIDAIIIKDDTPISILGILPDTTNYFCLFYFIHADDVLPAMISYDKNGMLISQKRLAESCWQGCESDCRSILKINKDLTIELDYEEFLFECDDDRFSNIPNEASGYVEYSKIDGDGQLTVVKKVIKTKKELAKKPIIHTIQK